MLMTVNRPSSCFKSLFVLLQHDIAEKSTSILTKMSFQTITGNMAPANGHIDVEDKETEHISLREDQSPLHANTSTITTFS